jgi:hypothetical protein
MVPWQKSWHDGRKIGYTRKMWESIHCNWGNAWDAIEDIPERNLERRPAEAPAYWKQERDRWQQDFSEKLAAFNKMNDAFGVKSPPRLLKMEKSLRARIQMEESALKQRIVQKEVGMEEDKERTQMSIGALPKERRWTPSGRSTEEVLRRKADLEIRLRIVRAQIQEWKRNMEEYLREPKEILSHTLKSIQWQSSARLKRAVIKEEAARKLEKINRMQEREYRELFPPTDDQEDEQEEFQIEGTPLDVHQDNRIPFQAEAVQGARSRDGNWRVPQDGSRVEPTQLSARRGPPTDRPPDEPPPWKGVFRGCLLERGGTPHVSQLASFTRGSYCLIGNATPLQKMQFKGCAPSNNSASRAVGSSQNSGTRLASRAGGLRGVVGSGSTGYVCDNWSPSSKPGS